MDPENHQTNKITLRERCKYIAIDRCGANCVNTCKTKNAANLLTTQYKFLGTIKQDGPYRWEEGQFPKTKSNEIYVILLTDYDNLFYPMQNVKRD